MGRRKISSELTRHSRRYFFITGLVSCSIAYLYLSSGEKRGELVRNFECCKGIEHSELWGDAVKWGADYKVDSAEECCKACKEMCDDETGECLCDSWVYCGDKDACGIRFGEV